MIEKTHSRTTLALCAGVLLLLAGVALVVDRGGVIAWLALLSGGVLLLKRWRRPSSKDVWVGTAIALVLTLGWFATLNYVLSTWESGEVVELVIDTSNGEQTARLWVLDIDSDPVIYYDANPAAAQSLLAGNPVRYSRGADTSVRVPRARLADDLPPDESAQLLDAMQSKYGARNSAATVYYLMLGRERDRIGVVAYLEEPQPSSQE